MNRIKQLLSSLKNFTGLFLLLLSLFNFYLSYRASSVVNLHSYTVTNVVEMVTFPSNFVSSSSVPSNSVLPFLSVPSSSVLPSSPVVVPKEVLQVPYQYFVIGHRVGAHMFGRFYYDGSPCSYGRIEAIFPDRIILRSGDWISNRFDVDSRKVAKNDR